MQKLLILFSLCLLMLPSKVSAQQGFTGESRFSLSADFTATYHNGFRTLGSINQHWFAGGFRGVYSISEKSGVAVGAGVPFAMKNYSPPYTWLYFTETFRRNLVSGERHRLNLEAGLIQSYVAFRKNPGRDFTNSFTLGAEYGFNLCSKMTIAAGVMGDIPLFWVSKYHSWYAPEYNTSFMFTNSVRLQERIHFSAYYHF